MHCCHGNHILETHWYWSLFAFADEVLGAGARPPGSLRGAGWRRGRKGESDEGQEKERQEGRGDGEKERKEERRKKRREPDGLSGACRSRGFAQQQRKYSVQSVRACVSELSEGKGPELEPRRSPMPVGAKATTCPPCFYPIIIQNE